MIVPPDACPSSVAHKPPQARPACAGRPSPRQVPRWGDSPTQRQRPHRPIAARRPGRDPHRMCCRAALPVPRDENPAEAHRRSAARATTAAGTACDRSSRDARPSRPSGPHAPEPCRRRRQPRSRWTEPWWQNPIHRGGARCASRRPARGRLPRQDPMHQFVHHPAQHANRCRDGNSPCTMNIAMPPDARPRLSRAATVRHAAKQARLNADAEQMHAKHADGPGSGTVLHGRHRTTEPGEPRRYGPSCPIRVHRRPSACICVRPCLLRRAPIAAATVLGSDARARTPCTNSPVPPPVPRQRIAISATA